MTSITIPNSVTEIGYEAFYDCDGLTSVTIPNSVTSIASSAFYNCDGLTSITIPYSVASIGKEAFGYCYGLTSVTIGNSVRLIGDDAFNDCTGLTSITIGNSVTKIGDGAFNDCRGLTSITIPNSVTSIGKLAFQGCTGLKSVYCKATTPPTAGYSMFDSETLSGTLYIPNGSIGAYKAVEPWGNFANVIETGVFPDGGVEGIESIGINVAVKGGAIEVSGAEGERIEVYSLSGQCVYSGMEASVPVKKGIYIVRVAGTVHKVIL